MTSIAAYYQLIVASHAKHDEETFQRAATRRQGRSFAERLRSLVSLASLVRRPAA